jgi:hypothetical protein
MEVIVDGSPPKALLVQVPGPREAQVLVKAK